MAYEHDVESLWIAFEAEPLAGLVIHFRPAPVDAIAAIIAIDDYSPDVKMTVEEILAWQPVCRVFAGLITSWNVVEGGRPAPASAEAFLRKPARWQLQVAKAWARVMVGLPQTIPAAVEPAEAGFDESTIPMEPLAV